MRLAFSTSEFRIANQPIAGFPLLLSSQGELLTPPFNFLIHHLLHRGTVQSARTWTTYGYSLFDYFAFLERSGRTWDQRPAPNKPSIVALYRRAALARNLSKATVSFRIELICSMYKHALRHGWINQLPFILERRTFALDRRSGMAPSTVVTREVPDVALKVPQKITEVLTAAETQTFLSAFANRTHKLMALFQVSTGVRVEELVTFPLSRIVDPRLHPNVRYMFPVKLDPVEMSTKGSVERVIHVPRGLMEELWAYAAVVRPRRLSTSNCQRLFLTESGEAYSRNAVWYLYKRVGEKIMIKIFPHLLRHTFATHTLAALRNTMNIGNALLYIKDRLGHSSIKTTEKYFHLLDQIADDILNDYQEELLSYMNE